MNISNVQLVGGHADGTELSVIDLPPELHFQYMEKTPYEYGNWNQPIDVRQEIYVLLPGTTIYIFKRMG